VKIRKKFENNAYTNSLFQKKSNTDVQSTNTSSPPNSAANLKKVKSSLANCNENLRQIKTPGTTRRNKLVIIGNRDMTQ